MTEATAAAAPRTLSQDEAAAAISIKARGAALVAEIKALEEAGSREISLACTKVEEAVMWALAHITKPKAGA